MQRQNTEPIAIVLQRFLQENRLEKPLLERQVVHHWGELMGALVSKYTGKIEIRNGILYVQILSAALRQEMFICRQQLVKKINDKMQAQVINDIRLLG